jgi:transposase
MRRPVRPSQTMQDRLQKNALEVQREITGMKKLSETLVGMGGTDIRVGLDVSDVTSRWSAVDVKTGQVREGQMTTTPTGVRACFAGVEHCTLVLEAGTHSHWLVRELTKLRHRAVVVDPATLDDLLGKKRRRNDGKDARGLREVAVDVDRPWVRKIWQRSEENQKDLALVRARDVAVRARAQIATAVRGLVKPFGERIMASSVESLPAHARENLSGTMLVTVEPLLKQVEGLTAAVREYDKQVDAWIAGNPVAKRLMAICGVGPIIAMVFIAVVGDARRFLKSRDVAAYLGLVPDLDQSGAHDPQLHISKAGDPLARRTLLQGAHFIMSKRGEESAMRDWSLALAGDGKNKIRKRKAAIALARKLATILHRLWVSGEEWDPRRGMKEKPRAEMMSEQDAA